MWKIVASYRRRYSSPQIRNFHVQRSFHQYRSCHRNESPESLLQSGLKLWKKIKEQFESKQDKKIQVQVAYERKKYFIRYLPSTVTSISSSVAARSIVVMSILARAQIVPFTHDKYYFRNDDSFVLWIETKSTFSDRIFLNDTFNFNSIRRSVSVNE